MNKSNKNHLKYSNPSGQTQQRTKRTRRTLSITSIVFGSESSQYEDLQREYNEVGRNMRTLKLKLFDWAFDFLQNELKLLTFSSTTTKNVPSTTSDQENFMKNVTVLKIICI